MLAIDKWIRMALVAQRVMYTWKKDEIEAVLATEGRHINNQAVATRRST